MIILDTNVISEGLRVRPNEHVRAWLDAGKPNEFFLCAPVLAELRFGIERLPVGAKRRELDRVISAAEEELFANRLLPFDRDSAHEFGRIVAVRAGMGLAIAPMDAMIAAIAITNGMAVATRDVSDFDHLAILLINPFEPGASRRPLRS
jgi:predicted nucleic acid-binding protein